MNDLIYTGCHRLLVAFLLVTAFTTDLRLSPADDLNENSRPIQIDGFSARVMFPSRADFLRPDQVGMPFDEVRITNPSGEQLRGWFFPAADAKHTVLFCMGNTGNIGAMLLYARLLTNNGFNAMLFDYQGVGGSSGAVSVLSLHTDALSVFDYLTDIRKIPAEQIGIYGVSLGSLPAFTVAAERPVGALLVEDVLLPADHLQQLTTNLPNDVTTKLAITMVQNVVIPRVDPLRNVKQLQCPLCLIHGEHDRLLPPTGSLRVAAQSSVPTRVWIIQNAGHAPETLEVHDREYVAQVAMFLQDAFANRVESSTVTHTCKRATESWETTIVACDSADSAWQLTLASTDGQTHLARFTSNAVFPLKIITSFEPAYAHFNRIHHATLLTDGTWEPELSEVSTSLKQFREFESRMERDCGFQTIEYELPNGNRIKLKRRQLKDAAWLLSQLPDPEETDAQVRPRYARLLAEFFVRLPREEQQHALTIPERLIAFLPADPNSSYQLDNGSFQLGLQDRSIEYSLVTLARHRFQLGELDRTRELLQQAAGVAVASSSLKTIDLHQLRTDSNFDIFIENTPQDIR
ncbi:MAG: alpha/beta hydrolase [Planctomycetaceae bacterium]|nr:alpha/beta hydrolase [Planctomycetaceae bacterium]